MNRGALPLAILIVAALAAGIALALIQPGDLGEEAAPEPTAESPLPTTPASPEPTIKTPSPEPTAEPEPTEEPTPEPEPTEDGAGGQNGQAEPTLAETGGPVLPWLLGGALLFAGGAALWRLRRRVDETRSH